MKTISLEILRCCPDDTGKVYNKVRGFCRQLIYELKDWTKYSDNSDFRDYSFNFTDSGKVSKIDIIYYDSKEYDEELNNDKSRYFDHIVLTSEQLKDHDKFSDFIRAYKNAPEHVKWHEHNMRMKARKRVSIDGQTFIREKLVFRAKDKNDDSWAYGIPIISKFHCEYMLTVDVPVDFIYSRLTYPAETATPIDGDTLCIYTGKKIKSLPDDIDKSWIFTGDVIDVNEKGWNVYPGRSEKIVSSIRGVVEFFDGAFQFIAFLQDGKPMDHPRPWFLDTLDLDNENVIVIGNRIDHPELVEPIMDFYDKRNEDYKKQFEEIK